MRNIEKGLAKARARSPRLRPVPSPAAPSANVAEFPPLDLRRLMSVPLDPRTLARHRIVTDEFSAASAAYKMLRTRVLQRMRSNGWKTLAVTGTGPDEGKSLTAINLSISLARDSRTSVMLLDMDLRKPSIHHYLGIAPRRGIGDYLRGAAGIEEIALSPEIDRLGVIPGERAYPSSSEMLSSPQAARLVEEVRRGEGRIVVFDLPPVLASDDLLAFCPLVDAVLLVVAQGITQRADVAAARDMLQDVNVVGAVLNRSTEHVAPYYYTER